MRTRNDSGIATMRSMHKPERVSGHEQLMMPEEVAELLSVSKGMVYKLVRTGKLEAVHIGRLVRIPHESYDDLLARRGA